jgi:hypothetical protein
MSWIRRSPFGRDEDPLKYMLKLVSAEAKAAGVTLTEQERKILTSEYSRDRTSRRSSGGGKNSD